MAPRKKPAPAAEPASLEEVMSSYDAALAKASDPNMTTEDNPLATVTPEEAAQQRVIDHNMEQLYQDARLRRRPNGGVYAAMMKNRYNSKRG